MSASRMVPPATPVTEQFYEEARTAGFTLPQMQFLERWFQFALEEPRAPQMQDEYQARVEYVEACRAAGEQPEPWRPWAVDHSRV